ncbi:hypothetical protein D3C80_1729960 [compost metagenome]
MLPAIAGTHDQALLAHQYLTAIDATVEAVEVRAVTGHLACAPVFAGIGRHQELAIAAIGDHLLAIGAPDTEQRLAQPRVMLHFLPMVTAIG